MFSLILSLTLIAQAPNDAIGPGTTVVIHASGVQTDIPVATSILWADNLLNAMNARDLTGFTQMASEGKIALIPDGTEALVIRPIQVPFAGDWAQLYEVRIKDAKYYVPQGWVTTRVDMAREKKADARKAAIVGKNLQRKARQKLAKSKLTPEEREAQIQKNLAKNQK